MFIMTGHTAKLEDLPYFQPVRLPNGEIVAVMCNKSVWTYVLHTDGSTENIYRGTVVDVLASQYDVVIAGLQQLEREIAEKSKHETSRV